MDNRIFKEIPKTPVEIACFRAKKETVHLWRALSPEEYKEHCQHMAEWFKDKAETCWDEHQAARKEMKAKSDEEAKERVIREKMNKK